MISRNIVDAMQEAARVMEAAVGEGGLEGSASILAALESTREGLVDALAVEGIHGPTHEHRWIYSGGVDVCWCGTVHPDYQPRERVSA